jgi:hypothetical protein
MLNGTQGCQDVNRSNSSAAKLSDSQKTWELFNRDIKTPNGRLVWL